MENIIILILFTYPGAIADFIHSRFTDGMQFDNKPEEYFRIARDFFLSALISMASLWVYCGIKGQKFGLSAAVEKLKTDDGAWLFAGMTVIGAILAAAIWTALDNGKFSLKNEIRKKAGKSIYAKRKSVWECLVNEKDIPFDNCVLAFYQDGKLIRAGMPHTVSDDYKNDPWAILTWPETARMELEQPEEERTLLRSVSHSFVNFENGITVDVYDATRFRKFISSWRAEPEEEHSGQEVEAAE